MMRESQIPIEKINTEVKTNTKKKGDNKHYYIYP